MKKDFPIFQNDKELVYLDSAATTQKPLQVIEEISNFYNNSYSNVHRSNYKLSHTATELFENARKKVANFISADSGEIIFTKNATEALNLISHSLELKKGDAAPWHLQVPYSSTTIFSHV